MEKKYVFAKMIFFSSVSPRVATRPSNHSSENTLDRNTEFKKNHISVARIRLLRIKTDCTMGTLYIVLIHQILFQIISGPKASKAEQNDNQMGIRSLLVVIVIKLK